MTPHPSLQHTSHRPWQLPKINVRTYVTIGGKPGVWFFSLDVPSRLAV